ncbi:hypothetical protein Tco_0128476 [Tanacetum coccineum]
MPVLPTLTTHIPTPLPPSLYIPPPIDHRDDIPESEQPPCRGGSPEIAPMIVGEVHETHFQMQQAELAALRETDRRRQDQMVETLRVIRDMRREMSDMQAELLALREQQRRARQPGPDARIPDLQDASRDADSLFSL